MFLLLFKRPQQALSRPTRCPGEPTEGRFTLAERNAKPAQRAPALRAHRSCGSGPR